MTDDPTPDEIREAVRRQAETLGMSVEELLAEMEQLRPEVEARNAEEARYAHMTPQGRAISLWWKKRREAGLHDAPTYQGTPCKHGHDGRRYVSGEACFECTRASATAQAQRRREAGWKKAPAEAKAQERAERDRRRASWQKLKRSQRAWVAEQREKGLSPEDIDRPIAERRAAREEKRERWRQEAMREAAKPGYIRGPW